jgi:hypothetical protein
LRNYTRLLWLSVAIWIAGAVPVAVAGYLIADALFAPVHEFEAPGRVSDTLRKGDQRAILLHTAGSSLGRIRNDSVSGGSLRCTASAARGDVTVRPHTIGAYSVSKGRDSYVAKLAFTAPRAGRYTVTCLPATAVPLALSRRLHVGLLVGLGFGSLALCAAAIMTGVKVARRARLPTRR